MAFTWFDKFTEAFSLLGDDPRAAQLKVAVIDYGMTGEATAFDDPLMSAFLALCVDDIDNSHMKRTNAGKGGRPKKPVSRNTENQFSEKEETSSSGTEKPVSEDCENQFSEKPETQYKTIQANTVQSNTSQEGEGRAKTARFIPPTPQEVDEYTRNRGTPIDGARFCDFYASKGWRVGSSPMKDWKAAARNWAGRDRKDAAPIVGAPAAGEGGWMPDAG